jgi:hypothetical protein
MATMRTFEIIPDRAYLHRVRVWFANIFQPLSTVNMWTERSGRHISGACSFYALYASHELGRDSSPELSTLHYARKIRAVSERICYISREHSVGYIASV